MKRALLALSMIAAPASAQAVPKPYLAEGEELEVETRAYLNGDRHIDLAYIVRTADRRELRVVTTAVSEVDIGEGSAQVLVLDPYPLGSAELTTKGNVLLLEDLTGGTTAVSSTHRFRWDDKLAAMRLIGLDAKLYSRTFAHDGAEASWNLLTGDLFRQTLRLRKDNSDIAYDKVDVRRIRKPSPPVRLETSPSGNDLLNWPGAK